MDTESSSSQISMHSQLEKVGKSIVFKKHTFHQVEGEPAQVGESILSASSNFSLLISSLKAKTIWRRQKSDVEAELCTIKFPFKRPRATWNGMSAHSGKFKTELKFLFSFSRSHVTKCDRDQRFSTEFPDNLHESTYQPSNGLKFIDFSPFCAQQATLVSFQPRETFNESRKNY